MKLRSFILAFLWLLGAAAPAIAQTPKFVHVPAGDLSDALESLAKQCGVDVIYPGDALKGQKTEGISGTLEPVDAFNSLLEGTSLVLSDEGGALLITYVASAPEQQVAQRPEDPLAEVEIEAPRAEELSTMRAEIGKLEDRFFAAYNKLNDIRSYDVACEQAMLGHIVVHRCQPMFNWLRCAPDHPGDPCTGGGFIDVAGYQKHMVDLVNRHPELLELLQARSELVQRYSAVRRKKFEGKIFVWN